MIVSLTGDFGKTRPALVIQDMQPGEPEQSVTICMITSTLVTGSGLRVDVEADTGNGLERESQIQADKIQSLRRHKLRGPIGHLDSETMAQVDLALALHLKLCARETTSGEDQ